MLLELRIRNFAIIDEVNLSFSKGFHVITGETGAGKSIILNAVQLLMGDQAGEELIRSSEEEASVEALFDITGHQEVKEKVKEKGTRTNSPGDDNVCLVRRVVSRSGRGKVFLNEHLTTLGTLSEIGEALLTASMDSTSTNLSSGLRPISTFWMSLADWSIFPGRLSRTFREVRLSFCGNQEDSRGKGEGR